MSDECKTLDEVRDHIDRLDEEILALMAERAAYVTQAARFKDSREGVFDPVRVESIIEKIRSLATAKELSPDVAEATFRAMIKGFIEFEKGEFDRLHGSS